MSRASYNSLAQKHRVDAEAARNLALAQTLSEAVGRQKAQAARDRQLNIAPPPAQYQSSAEAAADYAHANQQAIQTLESFMYPKDAQAAFGDLLKHDQIAEFNQYGRNFKQALGDQKRISYIEFINYWQTFIERLQSEINRKALYLTPEEKQEYTENEKMNKTAESFNEALNYFKNRHGNIEELSLEPHVSKLPIVRKTGKAQSSRLAHQASLSQTFLSDHDIDKLNKKELEAYARDTVNPRIHKGDRISYSQGTKAELQAKVKHAQKSAHQKVATVIAHAAEDY